MYAVAPVLELPLYPRRLQFSSGFSSSSSAVASASVRSCILVDPLQSSRVNASSLALCMLASLHCLLREFSPSLRIEEHFTNLVSPPQCQPCSPSKGIVEINWPQCVVLCPASRMLLGGQDLGCALLALHFSLLLTILPAQQCPPTLNEPSLLKYQEITKPSTTSVSRSPRDSNRSEVPVKDPKKSATQSATSRNSSGSTGPRSTLSRCPRFSSSSNRLSRIFDSENPQLLELSNPS